ncbi:hypothetical protein MANES_16G031102v8 [Manihot esculenta]|uniref:Uncharacterized protein n=1 Tax=Manihot esculenta TaxID=3983 RepID=A0ACB7G552_MANES|nr:hypothetical protein MANES_16G031102v8 [Manihot esculenta]
MDSDFWTSRLVATKRQYTLRHHHQSSYLDGLSLDDFEVVDEVRPEFPCPYCYEDFDIASLCSHLEDEHPCKSKVIVCPICSVKVARDMLSHITLQHRHLIAITNSQALSLLGRDLREAHLQVLLGSGGPGGYRSINSNFRPSLSYEEREKRMRQAAGRAGFVQDLILSTLLSD